MPDAFLIDGLLQSVLEASLTGFHLLRPLYNPAGEISDFAIVYLNPAGQLMLGLPERPEQSMHTQFPTVETSGVFAFYRKVFETGAPGRFDLNYQADGLDNYFRLSARRNGELLVVSFTDTADQDRSVVEVALRESQAREQAARAEAEAQRSTLQRVFEQAPVAIGIVRGPELIIEVANPLIMKLWGKTPEQTMHHPLFDALPEARGQGFEALFEQVLQTGTPVVAHESPVRLERYGKLETPYFNFAYQPLWDAHNQLNGVIIIATEVTQLVEARQKVQTLNEELAAANKELQAANEEFTTKNEELALAQQQLQQLNQELEGRVEERTHELLLAQGEAVRQQQRLEGFFSQAPAAICILDGPDMVFELVNEAYQALFPGRRLLGRPLLQALPELAGQPVWHTLRRVYETGETHEETGIHIPVARHEQEQPHDFYFHYIQQARYNEQGQIDGVLVFALDMTNQVIAQRQTAQLQADMLAVAQQRAAERESFFQVFEQTPAVVSILQGPEHRISYHNQAYQQLFPGRQMRGLTVAQAQPEAVDQGFVALLDEVYRTGQTFFGNELPIFIAQADGQPAREIFFNFTYQAYRENGQIVGVSVFAYDVTEQVLARQQRAQTQARLQAMFEQAPVAIAILQGPDYVVDVANPLVCTLWGRSADEVIGRPLLEALPEVRGQGFKEILDNVVQKGEAFVAQEVTAMLERRGQLEQVYLNFVYQPLRDEFGHITSVAAVATEVSEQVAGRQQVAQANEQLRQANAELDATNQQLTRTNVDLDNFIYTASHDLKAPITNIEGLLAALREQLPNGADPAGDVQALLTMMEGAIERFQKTIGHLTDISRLQQVNNQAAEAIDLASLVEDVRLDLAPELNAARAWLHVDVQACPTISFAPKNLRSIVYNLLSNALKYRAPERPPVIGLRAYCENGLNIVEVQDNGLGLSEGQQTQLFTMFQRLHSHVDGSGVGLYMVKKIVENAGGSIAVRSQLGVGSTFTVSLPG
ncbi:PAS domain-containing protein [Hymenobacter sp. BRD67]|uniref:PAS domain-containing protein n=1 Tax=Hymenobacter sp. BRD67 TaxID=2675877 RepID=UPI0015644D2E|nr:PAS domain-containing protein [Hymenobacter sp. BRD67]QKG52914.1 PAS domain-containing protein [Hymenobacter sp. BRD67]